MKPSDLLLPFKGEVEWLVLFMIVLCICLYYPIFVINLVVLLFKIYRRNHHLAIYAMLIALVFFLRFNAIKTIEPDLYEDAMILSIDEESKRYLVKGNVKYYVYYEEDLGFEIGDIIKITGLVLENQPITFPHQFDMARYNLSKAIHGRVEAKSMVKVNEGFTFHALRAGVNRHIDETFDESKPYIKTFMLADKEDFDEQTQASISALGVAHLFAVSGLHISFVCIVLFKGLSLFNLKETFKYLILSMVLLIYLLLTAFSPSILRASIMVFLLWVNKRYKLNFTPFDLLGLLFIGLLLLNPYYIHQTGFILTFLVSGTLLLSHRYIASGSKLVQSLKVSLIAYLITLPIITQFTYQIAPMTILFNLLFVPYTMILLLPLGYLTFFFPFIEPLYGVVIGLFEWLLTVNEALFYIGVNASFFHPFTVFIYYVLCVYALKYRRRLKPKLTLGLYIGLIILSPNLNPTKEVTFFNVYGDSMLLRDQFNQCNVLIDTGSKRSSYNLIASLKSKRIDRIDILFISHFHEDHVGAYEDLSKKIPIKKLVHYGTNDKTLSCGSFNFEVFTLSPSNNPNNEGIIVKALINQERYLFTGDIEHEGEQEAIARYNLEADYLKVAHHGAKTSTTQAFLDHVMPKEAIISVHQRNNFNHPDDDTIKRLNDYKIMTHRTDQEGSITFVYIFDKRVKKTVFKP